MYVLMWQQFVTSFSLKKMFFRFFFFIRPPDNVVKIHDMTTESPCISKAPTLRNAKKTSTTSRRMHFGDHLRTPRHRRLLLRTAGTTRARAGSTSWRPWRRGAARKSREQRLRAAPAPVLSACGSSRTAPIYHRRDGSLMDGRAGRGPTYEGTRRISTKQPLVTVRDTPQSIELLFTTESKKNEVTSTPTTFQG